MTSILEKKGLIRLADMFQLGSTHCVYNPLSHREIVGDQDIPLALALPGGKQPAKGTAPEPGPKGHRHGGFGRSLA